MDRSPPGHSTLVPTTLEQSRWATQAATRGALCLPTSSDPDGAACGTIGGRTTVLVFGTFVPAGIGTCDDADPVPPAPGALDGSPPTAVPPGTLSEPVTVEPCAGTTPLVEGLDVEAPPPLPLDEQDVATKMTSDAARELTKAATRRLPAGGWCMERDHTSAFKGIGRADDSGSQDAMRSASGTQACARARRVTRTSSPPAASSASATCATPIEFEPVTGRVLPVLPVE